MLEQVENADGTPQLGVAGDSYNTTVYLVRSLQGSAVSTSYVTALGTASYSDKIMSESADIALLSVDDKMAVHGDASMDDVVTRLRSFGVTIGALKRGAVGPLDLAGLTVLEGLVSVTDVVDTNAAGDCFNAGYLAKLALGENPDTAMRAGHGLASKVIRHRGAIMPTLTA